MARTSAHRWRMTHPAVITAVIYIAGLGAAAQFSKLAVAFVALREVYGGSETVLGLTVSLISLVGVLLGLFAGMTVARIGPRRALLWALGGGALVSLLQATLPALPVMMASRVLEGLSHLLIVVAAPTLLAERVPETYRAGALTLWSTFFGVAFALTAIIAPTVVAYGGLSALLIGHAGWMALAFVCASLTIHSRGVRTAAAKLSILARHVAAYSTPGIATPALAWLCYTLTFVSVLTALPLLVGETDAIWLATFAPLLSISVALTLTVALLAKQPARPVLAGGFVMCATACVVIGVFGFSLWTVLLFYACTALVQGAGFAVVPQLNPDAESRALANGALAQMGNVGNLLGTPVLIALQGAVPPVGPVLFLTGAYLFGLWAVVVFGRKAAAQL